MNNIIRIAITFLSALVIGSLQAEEIVAVDTIQFVANRVEAEPDPTHGEYVFAMWGSALDEDWKLQIDYYADQMQGTFSDDDFRLTSGGGSYNYLRKAHNDMWMRSFKHLDVTVTEQMGATHLSLNGLIQDYGQWRRVLVEAEIEAPAPTDTISLDLGVVMEVPNSFMGYTILEARNADYTLTFGISGVAELEPRTYYQVELLRPDFVRLPSDTIAVSWAQLEVTEGADEGLRNLALTLLSQEQTLYQIAMHTGAMAVQDTVVVECAQTTIRDLSDTYGIVQFYGEGSDYNVALSVTPGTLTSEVSSTEIPADSINLAFTLVARRSDLSTIRVCEASAQLVVDEMMNQLLELRAELLGTNGTRYLVSFPLSGGGLPAAADTVYVDCGEGVGRVDYTLEPGWVGLVLAHDEADIHLVAYNGLQWKGLVDTDAFDYSQCYVTTYADNDQTIRFADVQLAQMRMDSIGDQLALTVDAITVSNHMYHFTATMPAKRALTGPRVSYELSPEQSDALMVALRTPLTDSQGGRYRMQLQRADGWSEDGELLGDQEIWEFAFVQDSIEGIAGTYSYALETLDAASTHFLMEGGTEILLAGMVGTLTLEPLEELVVPFGDADYHTHLYQVKAEFLAPNNVIYELQGQQMLLCADSETGEMIELSEAAYAALERVLAERGCKVRKVLRNGMVMIECDGRWLRADGRWVKCPS